MKKTVFIALGAAFLLFGISAFLQSRPAAKDSRLYPIIQRYSPYYLEKRFGGLQIRDKRDAEFKEKPDNMELFHRFESLEKSWGKKHLRINGHTLEILDDHADILTSVPLKNDKEQAFLHHYYGI